MTFFPRYLGGYESRGRLLVLSLIVIYFVGLGLTVGREETMHCEICDQYIHHTEFSGECMWCGLAPLCAGCYVTFKAGELCDFCIEIVEEVAREAHEEIP